MSQLLRTIWQLMLLRVSPQVMPYSPVLLASLLLVHFLLGIALASYTLPQGDALLSAALGTWLTAAFSFLLLSLYSVVRRTVQVVTALAGCEIVIGLLSLPINAWYLAVPKSDAAIPALLSMILLGWNVAVLAHIFRHAVGVKKGPGFLIAVIYMSLSIMLASLI